jgi:hypothetical protein
VVASGWVVSTDTGGRGGSALARTDRFKSLFLDCVVEVGKIYKIVVNIIINL